MKDFIIQLVKGTIREGFTITKCTTRPIHFTSCKSRLVQADFTGGALTGDGGVVLLKEKLA